MIFTFFCFQILQHTTNWGMDMFAVGELTNERPLTALTFTIFKVCTFCYKLNLCFNFVGIGLVPRECIAIEYLHPLPSLVLVYIADFVFFSLY